MQRTYTGDCPYTNDIHSISVEYAYVSMVGSLKNHYKKIGFDCEHYDECQNDNCPIYWASAVSLCE